MSWSMVNGPCAFTLQNLTTTSTSALSQLEASLAPIRQLALKLSKELHLLQRVANIHVR